MKKQITILACVCTLAAGSAVAGDMQSKQFKRLDANQDGYISATEAGDSEALRRQWKSVDQDGNNRIDQSEFSALELQPQEESAE